MPFYGTYICAGLKYFNDVFYNFGRFLKGELFFANPVIPLPGRLNPPPILDGAFVGGRDGGPAGGAGAQPRGPR